MRKLLVPISLLLILIPVITIRAQIAGTLQDLVGDFTISLEPQFPTPGQKVTVTVQNYSIDLTAATETWQVNGKTVSSGKGATSVVVTAGSTGTRTTVTVIVNTADQSYTRSLVVEPATVDLIWQGNTYTPPFYSGRTSWGEGSSVTILAVPHVGSAGNELNPKNLVYKWLVDNQVQGDQSGVGRSTLTLSDNGLSTSQTVLVEVMTDMSNEVAEGTITVSPTTPSLVVYEDNPLYGIIFGHQITDTISIKDPEVSFAAFPLALDVSGRNDPNTHYSWSVNGSLDYQYGNKVTYRAPATGPGQSNITAQLESTGGTYNQTASTNFLVQFNNQNGI